jgi:hypothetical protein
MPAQQGLGLEDYRRVEQRREQSIEADEDQTVCRLQPGAGWRCAFQDDELLPEISASRSAGERRNHLTRAATNLRGWAIQPEA